MFKRKHKNPQQTKQENLFLSSMSSAYPIQLHEDNKDYISEENFNILKSLNFHPHTTKVSYRDLLDYLPYVFPYIYHSRNQKCIYHLNVKLKLNVNKEKIYQHYYSAEYVYGTGKVDYLIPYTDNIEYPAFSESKNPLESALNLVYWFLKHIVNKYNQQIQIRSLYFNDSQTVNPDYLDIFSSILGNIYPDINESNQFFANHFIIKDNK